MKKLFAVIGILLLHSLSHASGARIERAEEKVKERLKDPESARFRNETVREDRDETIVCGEVNAKNSFGGYTGFVPFSYLMKSDIAFIWTDAPNPFCEK